MRIVTEHLWGSQERWDLGLARLSLECEPDEEMRALETGWLLYDGRWYQCRSVRIPSKTARAALPDGISMGVEEPDRGEVLDLWHEYMGRKGFRDHWEVFADPDRSSWLMARDGCGRLAGFTKMVRYNGGLESQINAHSDSYGVRIGSLMLAHEAVLAGDLGHRHLYIGAGYEMGSAYKAHVPGFEYWTGSRWCGDREAYLALCRRDSSIATIDDLDGVWRDAPPGSA